MDLDTIKEAQASKNPSDKTASTLQQQNSHQTKNLLHHFTKSRVSYSPENVFYLSTRGYYYAKNGNFYREFNKWTPIRSAISRFLQDGGVKANDIKLTMGDVRENIELDNAVDWAGEVAGYPLGKFIQGERTFLNTGQPNMFKPHEGSFPLLNDIMNQAFEDPDARSVFEGWLRDGIEAINQSEHQPAPMLVLAGQVKSGKSLLAWVTEKLLGGRTADPVTAWMGKLPWNDNLVGSELLLMDDSTASTDARARRALGTNFKTSVYASNVNINTRNKSSMSLRPVWRVMICCNEEPDNMAIIPQLEKDIKDKITLLRIRKINMPMPSSESVERKAFQEAIKNEMPAYAYYLKNLKTPRHLYDSRTSVRAWHDPHLLGILDSISPETALEDLIIRGIENGDLLDNSWYSAAMLSEKLTHRDAATYRQASQLLKYNGTCGRYLSKLLSSESKVVNADKMGRGRRREYYIVKG